MIYFLLYMIVGLVVMLYGTLTEALWVLYDWSKGASYEGMRSKENQKWDTLAFTHLKKNGSARICLLATLILLAASFLWPFSVVRLYRNRHN